MGHGLDLLDCDSYNGGAASRAGLIEASMWPRVYGAAGTPSGGIHELVASLLVGSRDALRPGLDVKGGNPDGSSRGFAFIAPTVKRSKTTGKLGTYRWTIPPDLDALAEGGDDSGHRLAAMVRQAKAGSTAGSGTGSPAEDVFADKWPHDGPVDHGGRENAIFRYACSLLSRNVHFDEALLLIRKRWSELAQPPEALDVHSWADAEAKLRSVYKRFPAGDAGAPHWDGEESTTEAPPDGRRKVTGTLASEIKPRPVRWLWDRRIALGTLCLLGGREGIGKSTLAYHLIAAITRGTLLGVHRGKPRAVIVCATEDSWEFTIVPRLMVAGADLTKVVRADVTTSDGVDTQVSLPRDLRGLEELVRHHGAALILLDPIMSRLGSNIDTHKDADVRLGLEPVVAIADRTGSAVIGLIHVNKSGSTDPLTLLMGSRAFAAVARAVLFLMLDPDDEDTRLLVLQPQLL